MTLRDRYISVPAAARMCGMSPRQFGRLLDDGVLPYLQHSANAHRRVAESDVIRFRDNIRYHGNAMGEPMEDLLRETR